ncbi:MAG: DUF4123 domain-containing protein [Desulfovibrio sp.]|jgi:hypothetical protein|nr:DUF4123 domain-containing protein [Desulfovibrio sp.]
MDDTVLPTDIEKSPFTMVETDDIAVILARKNRQEILCSMCLLMNNPELTSAFFEQSPMYDALFAGTPYVQAMQASPYCRREAVESSFTSYLCRQRPVGFGWFAWGATTWTGNIAHWRSLLTVKMPNGTTTHLRLYSSGIMLDLLRGCSRPEIAALLGPMSGMAIPLSDSKWMCVEHPALKNDVAEETISNAYQYRPPPWWEVSGAQCEALNTRLEGVLVHNIRLDVWMNHPDWAEPFNSFAELDGFIAKSLKVAREWGFIDTEEQTQFVKLFLAGKTESVKSIPTGETMLCSKEISNAHKLGRLADLLGIIPWPV